MRSALRKGPFRLASAGATTASAPSRPGPKHTTPAFRSLRSRPIAGSGR
jgi:hypothetical protein